MVPVTKGSGVSVSLSLLMVLPSTMASKPLVFNSSKPSMLNTSKASGLNHSEASVLYYSEVLVLNFTDSGIPQFIQYEI
jgi:hypothetical protein